MSTKSLTTKPTAFKHRVTLKQDILRLLETLPKGKLLEVGCGCGDFCALAKNAGFDVTACDVNDARFEFRGEIPFFHYDASQAALPSAPQYDVVVSLEVIEHLTDPKGFIERLRPAVKPGGYLVISTVNILSLQSRMMYLLGGYYDCFVDPPLEVWKLSEHNPITRKTLHIAPLRYHELEFFIETSGFKLAKVTTSQPIKNAWRYRPLAWLLKRYAARKVYKWRHENRDFKRVFNQLLTKELLYGKHIILVAQRLSDDK